MARAKRTLLTLDVEEFCDASSILVSAEEYRAFLLGFQAGIRGTQGREDAGPAFMTSYTIGIGMLLKKIRTAKKCAKAGEKGHAALMNLRRMAEMGPDEVAPMGAPMGGALGRTNLAPMGEGGISPMGEQILRPWAKGNSAHGRTSPIGTEVEEKKTPPREEVSEAEPDAPEHDPLAWWEEEGEGA